MLYKCREKGTFSLNITNSLFHRLKVNWLSLASWPWASLFSSIKQGIWTRCFRRSLPDAILCNSALWTRVSGRKHLWAFTPGFPLLLHSFINAVLHLHRSELFQLSLMTRSMAQLGQTTGPLPWRQRRDQRQYDLHFRFPRRGYSRIFYFKFHPLKKKMRIPFERFQQLNWLKGQESKMTCPIWSKMYFISS